MFSLERSICVCVYSYFATSLGVSSRCADLRFDAQRTTKHQIDGCPISTTILVFLLMNNCDLVCSA